MIAHLVAQAHFQMMALEHALLVRLERMSQIAEQVFAYSVLQEPFPPVLDRTLRLLAHHVLPISLAMQALHLVFLALLAQPSYLRLLDVPLLTILLPKSLVFKLTEFYSLRT
jgi:hypothetical protein